MVPVVAVARGGIELFGQRSSSAIVQLLFALLVAVPAAVAAALIIFSSHWPPGRRPGHRPGHPGRASSWRARRPSGSGGSARGSRGFDLSTEIAMKDSRLERIASEVVAATQRELPPDIREAARSVAVHFEPRARRGRARRGLRARPPRPLHRQPARGPSSPAGPRRPGSTSTRPTSGTTPREDVGRSGTRSG
jgi:hypothetical protein